MIPSRRKHVATPCPLLLNGQPVDFVDSISYVGLTISADLSWSKHVKTITSKARQLVGLLFRQFYKHASTDTIRKIYLTIMRPHFWSMLVKFGTPTWLKIVRWLRAFKSLQAGCVESNGPETPGIRTCLNFWICHPWQSAGDRGNCAHYRR